MYDFNCYTKVFLVSVNQSIKVFGNLRSVGIYRIKQICIFIIPWPSTLESGHQPLHHPMDQLTKALGKFCLLRMALPETRAAYL